MKKLTFGGKQFDFDEDEFFDSEKEPEEKEEKWGRCYEQHPALKVGKGLLYGGSASWPKIKDADIYISLQAGSSAGLSSDPWDEGKGQVIEGHYSISDGHPPGDVPRFKAMVNWLCNQLHEGKKVHVGCIGGHGRTGMVLAAMVAHCLQEKDAIQYVRKHYCSRAVESEIQVRWLMKHYGVTYDKPSKSGVIRGFSSGSGAGYGQSRLPYDYGFSRKPEHYTSPYPLALPAPHVAKGVKTISPVTSSKCLWRKPKEKK